MKEDDKDLRDFEENENKEDVKTKESENAKDSSSLDLGIDSSDSDDEVNHDDFFDNKSDKTLEKEKSSDNSDMNSDKDSDNKSNLILGLVVFGIIAIIILVFLGIKTFYPEPEVPITLDDYHELNLVGELDPALGYVYNGYSFVKYDGLWYTQLQKLKDGDETLYNIPLHYGPRDFENISTTGDGSLGGKKEIYITFDPTEEDLSYLALAAAELGLNIAKGIDIKPIAACSVNETEACFDRPIVDCDSEDKDVIYLKKDNESSVVFDDNCAIIKGYEEDIVKATDKFILMWYGIIPI